MISYLFYRSEIKRFLFLSIIKKTSPKRCFAFSNSDASLILPSVLFNLLLLAVKERVYMHYSTTHYPNFPQTILQIECSAYDVPEPLPELPGNLFRTGYALYPSMSGEQALPWDMHRTLNQSTIVQEELSHSLP